MGQEYSIEQNQESLDQLNSQARGFYSHYQFVTADGFNGLHQAAFKSHLPKLAY